MLTNYFKGKLSTKNDSYIFKTKERALNYDFELDYSYSNKNIIQHDIEFSNKLILEMP